MIEDTRGNQQSTTSASPTHMADLYTCLSAARRCHVIEMLAESDDANLSVRYLARQIAAVEQGIEPKNATGEPYRNVYVALTQTHLDALAAAGVVQFDANRKIVSPDESLEVAYLLLSISRETYETIL